jgi:hypothetical protein
MGNTIFNIFSQSHSNPKSNDHFTINHILITLHTRVWKQPQICSRIPYGQCKLKLEHWLDNCLSDNMKRLYIHKSHMPRILVVCFLTTNTVNRKYSRGMSSSYCVCHSAQIWNILQWANRLVEHACLV